jgi:hypothetical protein
MSWSRNSLPFREPEGSSPCSQGPATGPNPQPDESTLPIYFQNTRLTPVWWPGVKNSPNVAHACRKRRLKGAPIAWGYSWAIRAPEGI